MNLPARVHVLQPVPNAPTLFQHRFSAWLGFAVERVKQQIGRRVGNDIPVDLTGVDIAFGRQLRNAF
jgi:hypothetical protein